MSVNFIVPFSLTVLLSGHLALADIVSNPGHLCGPETRENSSCGTAEDKAMQSLDGGEFPGEDESRVKKGVYLKDHPEGIAQTKETPETGTGEGSQERLPASNAPASTEIK